MATNSLTQDSEAIPKPSPQAKTITFSVDATLLKELGERLVGKPHIALAELVKNSYDADATKVIIRFGKDQIEIIDNGHGMSLDEFKHFWMRVGSPHKQKQRHSRNFGRPLTGSKGVGRLAVQFLARQLSLRTVSEKDTNSELLAYVNWNEAVDAGDLTQATAKYEEKPPTKRFPSNKPHGTSIILSDLNQEWDSDKIVGLAQEIWSLQPPFKADSELSENQRIAFNVELQSPDQDAIQEFEEYMSASLKIWQARLTGMLTEETKGNARKALVLLEFKDGDVYSEEYWIPDCELQEASFQIRIFDLKHRQAYGIRVNDAREYFREHGGVHVYDSGFHLPYYGNEDWLDIERDHARRMDRSSLLPEELQLKRGLNFLPKNYRLYGVVKVSTSKEYEAAIQENRARKGEYLQIQITRDRLVDNQAFNNLYHLVRWAMDFYAVHKKRKEIEKIESIRPTEPIYKKFERVDEVLTHYESDIPTPVYSSLRSQIKEAIDASEAETEAINQQRGLLGSLATAGISALAYEHEVQKQYNFLQDIAEEIGSIRVNDSRIQTRLESISKNINNWIQRTRATRNLFSHLLDEENRDIRSRFKARQLIRDVTSQMSILLRGVEIDFSQIDDTLRLPEAGYAEWTAIFQNVLINAVNATLDSPQKLIAFSSQKKGNQRMLIIQDTGSGVDLNKADSFFKPFVREQKISLDRRALGVGGTGLGLTIVRMIADSIGCSVSFIEPEKQFNTAFQISWIETT